MTKAPLHLHSLSKSYGSLQAVDTVSFSIEPGEIFGLLGPNGAGKTTIISIITTLELPSSGSVEVFGKDVVQDPRGAKALLGLVPQETISHGFFNLLEILDFHLGYYNLSKNQAWIEHLLHRLGLWEHRKKLVRQLSGGMKRRLAIAKALVHKPPLLLLDEPTAGVDIELRDALWNFVRELQKEGTTILLTTHHLEEAEELCKRVAIIDHGKILRMGPTKDLVQELTLRDIYIELAHDRVIQSQYLIHQEGRSKQFQIPSTLSFRQLLDEAGLEGSDIINVKTEEGSLEDAFRHVLRGAR